MIAAALNALGARPPGQDAGTKLEGTDFLGWHSQRFDTEAGPLDIVPHATAIGGCDAAGGGGIADLPDLSAISYSLRSMRVRGKFERGAEVSGPSGSSERVDDRAACGAGGAGVAAYAVADFEFPPGTNLARHAVPVSLVGAGMPAAAKRRP